MPWLNRELNVLLNENRAHINYVTDIIMDLLTRHDIRSPHFHDVLQPYFGERTHHFIHEFHSFATSPFDMIGFDQNTEYVPRESVAHSIVTEVQSSSSDSDSDVQVIINMYVRNTSFYVLLKHKNIPFRYEITPAVPSCELYCGFLLL